MYFNITATDEVEVSEIFEALIPQHHNVCVENVTKEIVNMQHAIKVRDTDIAILERRLAHAKMDFWGMKLNDAVRKEHALSGKNPGHGGENGGEGGRDGMRGNADYHVDG